MSKRTTISITQDTHTKLVKEVKKRKKQLDRNVTASEIIDDMLIDRANKN